MSSNKIDNTIYSKREKYIQDREEIGNTEYERKEKDFKNKYKRKVYSMDDETIFGKWAIEHKKMTDYNMLMLKNTIDEVDDIIKSVNIHVSNKEIFISCYMSLKSFYLYPDINHLLLYTNNTVDSEIAQHYIDELLQTKQFQSIKNKCYNKALHCKNCCNVKREVAHFTSYQYGIISCVYIFGEEFDLPKLNGVCVAGNMQSEIRIVQYLLRPNRIDKDNPYKMAYIIIPYIDMDDLGVENNSNNTKQLYK